MTLNPETYQCPTHSTDVTAHSSHHQCHAHLDLIASNAPAVTCNVAGS